VSTPAELIIPPIDQIESRIARDLARHALIVAPVLIIGVGLWRGPAGAGAVALALAIVCANFYVSAMILGWAARTSPNLLLGVALMGFITRLIIITAIGVGVKSLDIVDWPVFCITLVASHLGLLFWETRSISLSLASPGLKPRRGQFPGSHPGSA
jgi:hypothetical protein